MPQQFPQQDTRENLFDNSCLKTINQLMVEERYICGIKVKMPRMNIHKLKDYDHFLNNETYKNKLKFLKKTIFNTKQIKKTLDLRKETEIENQKFMKVWKSQPEKILKQKINIKKLKLKVKKKLQKQYNIKNKKDKFHKCPVYLCKFSDDLEDSLL